MTRIVSQVLVVPLLGAIFLAAESSGAASAGNTAPNTAPNTAVKKIVATMHSAAEGSPELLLQGARLGAEIADIRSELGAGAPTLSWHREGIGSGFDRRANAADYLRLTAPFSPPWLRGTANRLQSATGRLQQTGRRASSLELAASAARRWLSLAAEIEWVERAEERLARLEKTLAIQTRRYELGEISGSDRVQLELAVVRERAELWQSETRRFVAEQQVEVLTRGGFPLPVVGDLQQLAGRMAGHGLNEAELETFLEQGPYLRLAQIRSEVANLEAKSQRHSAWGRPEMELEWERIPSLGPADGFDALGFRFGYPLPIGKQGRLKTVAAERRATASEAERARLEGELVARLKAALQTSRVAATALGALQETTAAASLAERSLAEQFRLGAISYVVYLDGLSRLDQVRRQSIETHYTLLVARLELAELLGIDTYFPLPDFESEGAS